MSSLSKQPQHNNKPVQIQVYKKKKKRRYNPFEMRSPHNYFLIHSTVCVCVCVCLCVFALSYCLICKDDR